MTTMLRILLAGEAATFILAALVHAGWLIGGYIHREASVAESLIAAVLLAGLAATWVWPQRVDRAALIAQALALVGTLIGIFTMIVGAGPDSVPDIIYHTAMALVLIWGLGRALNLAARRRATTFMPIPLLLAAGAGTAGAQQEAAHETLGVVDFPVSCAPAAQHAFERGVALLHHMTYPDARAAFEEAARLDARCAMAHWGIAMTLFQPLWPTRPVPAELQRGRDAVQQALDIGPATGRERMFVESAVAFFQAPDTTDYWTRIRRWEAALANLHETYPHDAEAAAFYALAHLAAAPADTASRDNAVRAAALLLRVYGANPEHPGAMHYIVHASDATGRERESLEIVRRYGSAAPRNAHALHMPTHIYTRLGDWDAVIAGNLRAAEAALEQPAGNYVWDEFPHAAEYLVYAYLQQAADDQAAAQWRRLRSTADLQPTLKTAFHLASIPARYALERRAWQEALALEPRQPPSLEWDRFAWPEAITWFARGMGGARTGDLQPAHAAAARLDTLGARMVAAGETLFARQIRILALALDAWIAHARHDSTSSIARMRAAAELEAATPKHAVTPAPTLPALEMLGDLLLEQNRARGALDAYEQTLALYPHRFNALLGAARAARALADDDTARDYYRQLLETGGRGTRAAALDEARAFLR